MTYQAISFDVGGTLLYPWPSVGAIYAEIMARHEIHHTAETLETRFAEIWPSVDDIPRTSHDAAGEKLWWSAVVRRVVEPLGVPDNFDAMFDELWVAFSDPHRWRLYVGAEDTLAALKARGYRLIILSNWDSRLRPLLHDLRLERFFEAFIISSEVGVEKPNPGIFECAERKLGLRAGDILHIGDSEHHDADGCMAVGWPILLVDPSGRKTREPFLNSLPEILKVVD